MARTRKIRILHLITAAVLLITSCIILPLTAHADDKEYHVDSADFEVTLSENGQACITENWEVTYTKGSFTHFYKDIYDPKDSQLELIKGIEVLDCQINGEPAIAQNNTARNSGHYYVENTNNGYTIHWFQAAQDETVRYQIRYVIPGAVRLDADGRAVYSYRFIGENFPKTVGEATVDITLPSDDASAQATSTKGNMQIQNGHVIGKALNSYGMYRIQLNMDAGAFDDLGKLSDIAFMASIHSW